MLRQYFEMKSRVPDAILLYRMGDFYEMFFDDAREAAPLLGIALTKRHRDSDIEAPMCGVPHQAVDHHIAKLVAAGRKVAICDQVEDARAAKGLVRRDITRVVTPGTVLDPESLIPNAPSYLAAVLPDGENWGVAFLDLSTGHFLAGTVPERRVPDALALFRPREILLPDGAAEPAFAAASRGAGRPGGPRPRRPWPGRRDWRRRPIRPPPRRGPMRARCAPEVWLTWESRRRSLRPAHGPGRLGGRDPRALRVRRRLDVAKPLLPARPDTHAARRAALRETLAHPSLDPVELEARWDAVEELVRRADAAEALQTALAGVGDLERRFARIAVGTAGPREVAALAAGLKCVPEVVAAASALSSAPPALAGRHDSRRRPTACRASRRSWSPTRPSCSRREERSGKAPTPSSTSLCALRRDAQSALLAIEAEERRRSGIPTVKVRFNRVFGYSLEVGNAHRDKIPADWIRRQSLANAERFITPALKDLEEKILGAEDRIAEIESRLYAALLSDLARAGDRIARTAAAIGELDLFACFAEVARSGRWTRPRLSDVPRLSIVEGRHPLVERLRREEPFVPNDTDLDRRAASSSSPARTWAESPRTCARSPRSCSWRRRAPSCRPRAPSSPSATGSSRASAPPTTSRAASRPSWSRCSNRRRSCANARRGAS